jgi:hypothetical protein
LREAQQNCLTKMQFDLVVNCNDDFLVFSQIQLTHFSKYQIVQKKLCDVRMPELTRRNMSVIRHAQKPCCKCICTLQSAHFIARISMQNSRSNKRESHQVSPIQSHTYEKLI